MAQHNTGGFTKERVVPSKIFFRCHPDLKHLLEAKADVESPAGGVGEAIVRILATFFERPDLAIVPRQKRGPKGPRRRKIPA